MRQDNNKPQLDKPWWQDPLLHFIAIGFLIFIIDDIAKGKSVEENVIVINKRVKNELVQQFQSQNNRAPADKELDRMLEIWLQTELLYRKGLALGLDKNDPVIRDRVIQRMEFLFKNLARIKEPSEEQLRQWYKTKASDYQKPARYDFEHVLIRHQRDNAQQQAEDVLQQLTAGTKTQTFEQDYHAFVARNRFGLRVSFGEEFVEALDQLPANKWRIMRSNKGWHVVRLQAKHEDPLPSFEKIRSSLRVDWYKKQQREQVAKLIDELRAGYIYKREPS